MEKKKIVSKYKILKKRKNEASDIITKEHKSVWIKEVMKLKDKNKVSFKNALITASSNRKK